LNFNVFILTINKTWYRLGYVLAGVCLKQRYLRNSHERKMMNGKITTILLSFVCISLQAQAPLAEVANQEKAASPNPHEILQRLRENKHDHSLCTSLGIVFELWHENEYNREAWRKIAGSFFDVALCCQQGQEGNDDELIGALGPSCGKIYVHIKDKNGIHGNITIRNELHKIRFEGTIYRDELYDKAAWQVLIDLAIVTIEQCCIHDETQNITFLKHHMPLIGDAIVNAGGDSGIHGILEVKLNDTTNNYMGVSYTA